MKRIQDSVHGLMEFGGRERLAVEILRTPELQRLRRVRQLGLGHLVFPAAEHSRFSHAIGVAHLASRFAHALQAATRDFLAPSLQADETVARDLVLAGLCHDLGHGPLSHAWERHVVRSFDFTKWARALELPPRPWITEKLEWHELVTQACLLSPSSELHQYLEQVESGLSDRVAAILGDRYYLSYLSRLISSDVDIDRADFILRDAIQTGVAYGRYDLDWLVSTITVGIHNDEPVVGFDALKGPRVVEQFLVARRALYDTVYFHKAVQSSERMVGRLLALARKQMREGAAIGDTSGFSVLTRAITGEELPLQEVLELDDNLLWVFIDRLAKTSTDPVLKDIAQRIRTRELFRPLPLSGVELEMFLSNPQRATELGEKVINPYVPGEPRRYMLYHRVSYTFFEDDRRSTMFINSGDSSRAATPIREHPELFHHPRAEQVVRNMFVPREAVEPLTKAIRGEIRAGVFSVATDRRDSEGEFEALLEVQVDTPDAVEIDEEPAVPSAALDDIKRK